ncbi:MAG: NINE protein [Asgard group archaeon]|nr:NINE protein [Asgard group archaeon]
MILVCWFLGYLGIHRFLKKYWLSGFIWLCTGGLFGIGWIIDLIWIILDKPLIFAQ